MPGVATQGDLVVVVLLQQQGEVVGDLCQGVVVSLERSVQFHLEQLGPDVVDVVVREDEAGDLQIVLVDHVQHVVRVLAELVVGQVQHGGLLGQGGEGGQVLRAAVDNHRVGGGDLDPRCEVVEMAGALVRTVGVHFERVVLHHREEGGVLVGGGVLYIALSTPQGCLHAGGLGEGPGVHPGQPGGAGEGVS